MKNSNELRLPKTGHISDVLGFLKNDTNVVLSIDEINEAIADACVEEYLCSTPDTPQP